VHPSMNWPRDRPRVSSDGVNDPRMFVLPQIPQ
jgi:hypothetical protein